RQARTIQPKTAKLGQAADIKVERATGVEPATSSLGSWHSTAELRPLWRESRCCPPDCQLNSSPTRRGDLARIEWNCAIDFVAPDRAKACTYGSPLSGQSNARSSTCYSSSRSVAHRGMAGSRICRMLFPFHGQARTSDPATGGRLRPAADRAAK